MNMIVTKILTTLYKHEYTQKIRSALFFFQQYKIFKILINSYNNSNYILFLQNTINYIFTIKISKTNTLINLSTIRGNIITFFSSGHLNLTKKQKIIQPFALLSLLKAIMVNNPEINSKTVTLHFKNLKPYYESLLTNLLKKIIFINLIKSYNLSPHNGCRPKKIKRFKKRTKQF